MENSLKILKKINNELDELDSFVDQNIDSMSDKELEELSDLLDDILDML